MELIVENIAGVIFGGVNGRRKRLGNTIRFFVPIVGVLMGVISWPDLQPTATTVGISVLFYVWTMVGVSLGLHRYFTHRAFKCGFVMRYLLGLASCLTLQRGILGWVADHRRHHKYQDHEGDAHSPLVTQRGRRLGRFQGFLYAHCFWLFDDVYSDPRTFAPDLVNDALIRHFERWYWGYCCLSIALPALLGLALGDTAEALRCLVWAGCFRIVLVHHGTFAVNSFCHTFGARDYVSGDRSGNLWILAVLTLGEGWHHNHHASPSSAVLNFKKHQFDLGGEIIGVLERLGWVWDVRRVDVSRLRRLGQESAET